MFKKIFKAAKDLVKSPIGQIGIGLLAPQLAGASGILGGIGKFAAASPALFQGGISLLGGDKPENVLRNLALGAATQGALNVGKEGGFMGGISDFTGLGDGKTGTVADFFKKKDPLTIDQFLENKGYEGGIQGEAFQLLNPDDRSALITLAGNQPTASTFTNILNNPITPYVANFGVTAALAKMAADQAEDTRAFYNPDENPFFAAEGGGIQKFAMGSPEFPRMTGDISGPGTGTSDSIPAMLSDGEHVLTKQEVTQIGGGDNDLGHQRLYAARQNIRKQANDNGIGRI
jgi:hypothetical protein